MASKGYEISPGEDLARVISPATTENPIVKARSLGYTVINSGLLRHVMASAESVREAAEAEANLRGLSGIAKRKAAQAAVQKAEEEFQSVLERFVATPTKKRFISVDEPVDFEYSGSEVEERQNDSLTLGDDFEVIGEDGIPFPARELLEGDVISLRVTESAKPTTVSGSGKPELEVRLIDRSKVA